MRLSNIKVRKDDHADVSGGRAGTAYATREELITKLGRESFGPSDDGKVTIGWVFNTPRGAAEIRDYWWNKPGEWSLAAGDRRAALWLASYLRGLDIKASTKGF